MKSTYYDVQHQYKYIEIASLDSSPKHTWTSTPERQKVGQHPLLHTFLYYTLSSILTIKLAEADINKIKTTFLLTRIKDSNILDQLQRMTYVGLYVYTLSQTP